MTATYPLTLLYDAQCPVCSLEMDHLRSRCAEGRLLFVDISQAGFDAGRFGLRFEEVDAEIHAIRPDGSVIKGVEVLRLAYAAAGLGWVMRPTGWVLLAPAFDIAYRVFARHRRRISAVAAPLIDAIRAYRARRVIDAMHDCNAGACHVDPAANRHRREMMAPSPTAFASPRGGANFPWGGPAGDPS